MDTTARKPRIMPLLGSADAGAGRRSIAWPIRRRGRAGPAALAVGAALAGLAFMSCGRDTRSFTAPASRPPQLPATSLRAQAVAGAPLVASSTQANTDASFSERKAALKKRMAEEYKSFFRPFRGESYGSDMTFRDPLISTKGKDTYQWMIEMLAGSNFVGSQLFSDGFLDLHAIEEVPEDEYKMRTRWTAGLKFKMVPWTPTIYFTGISEYTLDANAQVLGQRDYWDTVNLVDDGRYATEPIFSGYGDMAEQMTPPFMRKGAEPPMVSSGEWTLLRRAHKYRVYRARDGTVFALGHPDAASADVGEISRALRKHGLSPGNRLRVQMSGSGAVEVDEVDVDGDASARKKPTRSWPPARDNGEMETVPGLELLRPHPWDGSNAPPETD